MLDELLAPTLDALDDEAWDEYELDEELDEERELELELDDR